MDSFQEYLNARGLGSNASEMGKLFREKGNEMIKEEHGTLPNALVALGWTDEILNRYELKPNDLIGAFGRAGTFFTPKDASILGLTPAYWFECRKSSKVEDWDWEFGSWVEVGRAFYKSMPIWKRILNRIVFTGNGWKSDLKKK